MLDARDARPPAVVHWGADLGDLPAPALAAIADASVPAVPPSSIDVPLWLPLLPSFTDGWSERPGLDGFFTDRSPVSFRDWSTDAGAGWISVTADGPLAITTRLELSEEGVLRMRHTVVNRGTSDFVLTALDLQLPVPDRAREVLDFSGLWAHERRPQRGELRQGAWMRESRHGRPGHDDAFLLVAGVPGFGFRGGEVWAAHLAWSGDKRVWAARSALGPAVLGAGELLGAGEVTLAPGDEYCTPWLVAVWSDRGLDGLSDRLHPWIRGRSELHRPRPVVLNTWEAVYFAQDLDTLGALADAAGAVGVERFVLDDGWFTGRRDDRRALGDWFVDAEVWPSGLHPLIKRVHDAGMDFGLWVEPEMVSPSSQLAAAHPDWVLGASGGPTWRFQRVLDLSRPGAYGYVLERLNALLNEYPIAFLKWDHNRDVLTPGVAHAQTTALYRLLRELRVAHPDVEIESCASGGGRVDLGILELVDRFWTSDTNDPLDRQSIQRWTSVLVPPEYLGGHLGDKAAHITGRTTDLAFRQATALFGSAGIEWNLLHATPGERDAIAEWIALHKRLRELLHTGRVVRADTADPAQLVHGVVAQDRRSAIVAYVTLDAPQAALPAPLRIPGLDQNRLYTVRPLLTGAVTQDAPPPWLASGSVTLPGRVLSEVGLAMPLLKPQQAALFEVSAA
ncbi:alpha-galactosidase [Catenuloplanes indicus]|uniref:alpha-galactosidase n=1 Tax=Catenuloplanes indicus TaxID=137267 RepID=A0AAE3VUX8_9ACTN|nr:alpha-galactosidase [Catenuloplanes indicus]MDQ0364281.1 alpha-galactosidase [Catenuloplanes indicus]